MSDNVDVHLTDRIELERLADLCAEDPEFSQFIPRLWAVEVASRKPEAGLSIDAYTGKNGVNENEWEYIEHDVDPDIANNLTLRAYMLFELWAKNGALPLVSFNGAPFTPTRDARLSDMPGYVTKPMLKAFCKSRELPKPEFWFRSAREHSATDTKNSVLHTDIDVGEEPGVPSMRVGDNAFKNMVGLSWADITITFTERDAVRIRARGRSETFTFDAMGFRHRSSHRAKPNQCWQTFKCLAIVNTFNKNWNDVPLPGTVKSPLKKRISQLRDELQQFFGLADDPIVYRRGIGYKAVFNLQAEDHAIQAEREECIASADENEEDDIQLLMSQEPYR